MRPSMLASPLFGFPSYHIHAAPPFRLPAIAALLLVLVKQDAVRLLAPSGAQVALRYEVRYPFAAWYAQQAALAAAGPYGVMGAGGMGPHHASLASALERGMKRYEVCRVQRAGRGGRGLPASYLQADFDVVVPTVPGAALRERMLAEAECIKVVTQVRRRSTSLGQHWYGYSCQQPSC